MDFREFLEKWSASSSAERANAQPFLTDLCDVLGVEKPHPTTGNPQLDLFVFEHDALISKEDGKISVGKIDLYKDARFVLEAKQGSDPGSSKLGTAPRNTPRWNIAMRDAFGQALGYARTLDNPPPFLITCDVGYCFDLYASFDGSGNYRPFPDALSSRIFLADLEKNAETFRAIFNDPHSLDPSKRSAKVTREIATLIANLARVLESAGHDPEKVAKFLMRCLFTMFAEDVDLLPKRTFADALHRWVENPDRFVPELEQLWKTMNEGGEIFGVPQRIWRFNGGLFADFSALPLTKDQIIMLGLAAESDWAEVEPAIFGTLLERALDPKERHRLGAHYTPRAYVERLVKPTIEEPLRAEWEVVQAEVRQIIATAKDDRKAMVDARKPVYEFYDRLCDIRVLDPACGSGNFLFVSLDLFKRLENEILDLLHDLGSTEIFNLHGRPVTPEQFLGIEIKPWAKEITELVLWIGYLQWQIRTRKYGGQIVEPILREYNNIECRDALLDYDGAEPLLDDDGKPVTRWDGETMKVSAVTGEEVPDETAQVAVLKYLNPRKATWPKADFVVGNPPFIGNKRMRDQLGDGYVDALRTAHHDVPDSADYVMYWWNHATDLLDKSEVRQMGLITTNSITQVFNRRVVERRLELGTISLSFAIADHPWVDNTDGAAVRIAMTTAVQGRSAGVVYVVTSEKRTTDDTVEVELESTTGVINSDLTIGTTGSAANHLQSNENLGFMGVTLVGDGFRIAGQELVALGYDLDRLPPFIREYRIGRDLTQREETRFVIDFFPRSEVDSRVEAPELFQWLFDRVRPERLHNSRRSYRDRWWLFAEPRQGLREAVRGLHRYVATCRTSKHRTFVFLNASVLPDAKIIAICLDDAFSLGVLSSRAHTAWSLKTGGFLEDRPNYNHSDCFGTFSFPNCSRELTKCIRDLGERLDAHRKERQRLHPDLTITGMYNVLEKLRANEPLTEKEKDIHEKGLVSILKQIHDGLDAAVFEAYGWPATLTDDQILERLVALNHERAEEEKRGIVRWLRPEFQHPEAKPVQQQIAITGLAAAPDVEAAVEKRIEWPAKLADRIVAVRNEFFLSYDTFDTSAVMKRFKRARRRDIDEVLESLEALGLLVSYGEGDDRQWKPMRANVSQPRLVPLEA